MKQESACFLMVSFYRYSAILNMEAIFSSEMSVGFHQTIQKIELLLNLH
jgi:hypothetical protein